MITVASLMVTVLYALRIRGNEHFQKIQNIEKSLINQ